MLNVPNNIGLDLNALKNFAKTQKNIAALYLFGSVARGQARRRSDVDLAIITLKKIDGFARVKMETLLSNMLGRDVDLVIFNESTPLMKRQILKYGFLIHENDQAERVRQEVFARYEYFDTKFLFKEINRKDNG